MQTLLYDSRMHKPFLVYPKTLLYKSPKKKFSFLNGWARKKNIFPPERTNPIRMDQRKLVIGVIEREKKVMELFCFTVFSCLPACFSLVKQSNELERNNDGFQAKQIRDVFYGRGGKVTTFLMSTSGMHNGNGVCETHRFSSFVEFSWIFRKWNHYFFLFSACETVKYSFFFDKLKQTNSKITELNGRELTEYLLKSFGSFSSSKIFWKSRENPLFSQRNLQNCRKSWVNQQKLLLFLFFSQR